MTNNDTFKNILHLTGLGRNKELLISIFELGGIKATDSKIKGWRTSLDNNRASHMNDNVLNSFFQGLFKYRDIMNLNGVQAFNFDQKEEAIAITRSTITQEKALIRCLEASKEAINILHTKHGCGWFDGGCFTFTDSVKACVPDVEIYHISRCDQFRDHAVIKLKNTDLYFDADGIQTSAELFRKMKELEVTNCNTLAQFEDFENYKKYVYADVKKVFIHSFLKQ